MKFGRKARVFRPMLHLSALLGAEKALPVIPESLNYGDGMPTDWKMMLNDQLGDCTCAAFYHALMVWSHVSRKFTVVEPDRDVLQLYEEVGKYRPGDPRTDNGAVEQDVLAHLKNVGAPIEPVSDRIRHKILGSLEVDHRNLDDVRRAIYIGGVAYIGFAVPNYMMQNLQHVWDIRPGDSSIAGGHAVCLTGYDKSGFRLISWGVEYYMTTAFFSHWVDEVYMLADPTWIEATGHTPANMAKADFLALF